MMAMFVPHGHKQPAVICILRSGDEVLLLKRNREPNLGRFTPVGGKLDPFESPVDAAVRETREETGLDIQSPRFCGTLVDSSPGAYNWICFVYQARISRVEPPVCDEGELKWISLSDLPNIPKPSTDMFVYEHLLAEKPFMLSAIYDKNLNLLSMREEFSGNTLYQDNSGEEKGQ